MLPICPPPSQVQLLVSHTVTLPSGSLQSGCTIRPLLPLSTEFGDIQFSADGIVLYFLGALHPLGFLGGNRRN